MGIKDVRFAPGGSELLVALADGRLARWSLRTGQPEFQPAPSSLHLASSEHTQMVDPRGHRRAFLDSSGQLVLIDASGNRLLHWTFGRVIPATMVWSEDGQLIAVASTNKTILIIDIMSGQVRTLVPKGVEAEPAHIALGSDGARVAAVVRYASSVSPRAQVCPQRAAGAAPAGKELPLLCRPTLQDLDRAEVQVWERNSAEPEPHRMPSQVALKENNSLAAEEVFQILKKGNSVPRVPAQLNATSVAIEKLLTYVAYEDGSISVFFGSRDKLVNTIAGDAKFEEDPLRVFPIPASRALLVVGGRFLLKYSYNDKWLPLADPFSVNHASKALFVSLRTAWTGRASPDGRWFAAYRTDGTGGLVFLYDLTTREVAGWLASFKDGEWIAATTSGYAASARAESHLSVVVGKRSWPAAEVPALRSHFARLAVDLIAFPAADQALPKLAPHLPSTKR